MGQAKIRGSLEQRRKQAVERLVLELKNKCIICREKKEKVEMSDEHVIPDSLNGYYHIYNVCKECNSSMGRFVDAPLVNHLLSKFYRSNEKISGKTGYIPNPLDCMFTHSSDFDIKYKMVADKDDDLKLKQIPFVSPFEKDEYGNINKFNIIVDSSDEEQIKKIYNKIAKRNNLDKYEVTHSIINQEVDSKVAFKGELIFDTRNFKLGLLKIAYEFAVDSKPNYFIDHSATIISKMLKEHDLKNIDYFVKDNGLNFDTIKKFNKIFDFEKNNHILFLFSFKKYLMCMVHLEKTFSTIIMLSKNMPLDELEWLVGINDISLKKFKKYKLLDYLSECDLLEFWNEN